MTIAPKLETQLFNAASMFGGAAGDEPGAAAFNAVVIDSLSEFDGLPVTENLVASINARILALQAVASEIIPADRKPHENSDYLQNWVLPV